MEMDLEAVKENRITIPKSAPKIARVWGSRGTRYDEECSLCHREGVIDNETELCQRCGSR
jgi:hypothetical protein